MSLSIGRPLHDLLRERQRGRLGGLPAPGGRGGRRGRAAGVLTAIIMIIMIL